MKSLYFRVGEFEGYVNQDGTFQYILPQDSSKFSEVFEKYEIVVNDITGEILSEEVFNDNESQDSTEESDNKTQNS